LLEQKHWGKRGKRDHISSLLWWGNEKKKECPREGSTKEERGGAKRAGKERGGQEKRKGWLKE